MPDDADDCADAPGATWRSARPADFAAAPYPGRRPAGSWRLTADRSGRTALHRLRPAGDGWQDQVTGDRIDLTDRHLVLGYASNLNPAKLAAKLTGEVVVLAAVPHGWAAAWCDARRDSDGSVIATLVRHAAAAEEYGVLAVTTHQLALMDLWEGHPSGYRRQPFDGRCSLVEIDADVHVEVYLGTAERRPTLLRDGAPVFCRDVPYEVVDGQVGRPPIGVGAPTDPQ